MSIAPLVALALLVTAEAGVAAGTTGTFTLVYRATPSPNLYDVQLIHKRTDVEGSRKEEPVVTDIREVVSRAVTANPDGTISINDTVLGNESFFSDREEQVNSPSAPSTPPRRGELITPRGERLSPFPKGELDACLAPVFPTEAIAPGHTWTSELEFPASSGQKIEVEHEFIGVETIHGQPCALVVSEVEVDEGTVKDVKFACKGHARTGISLTDGSLLESQTFLKYVEKTRPPGKAPEGTSIEILRTIVRRADGPATPPSPSR